MHLDRDLEVAGVERLPESRLVGLRSSAGEVHDLERERLRGVAKFFISPVIRNLPLSRQAVLLSLTQGAVLAGGVGSGHVRVARVARRVARPHPEVVVGRRRELFHREEGGVGRDVPHLLERSGPAPRLDAERGLVGRAVGPLHQHRGVGQRLRGQVRWCGRADRGRRRRPGRCRRRRGPPAVVGVRVGVGVGGRPAAERLECRQRVDAPAVGPAARTVEVGAGRLERVLDARRAVSAAGATRSAPPRRPRRRPRPRCRRSSCRTLRRPEASACGGRARRSPPAARRCCSRRSCPPRWCCRCSRT